MKKKFGAAIAAGVMACAVTAGIGLSGCGPVKVPTFEMPEGGYDGSRVTITFATTMGQSLQKSCTAAIKRFNELYPNITVNLDTTSQNYTELQKSIGTKLTSGRQPNIAFCYSDHIAQYNRSGAVVALDEYFLPGSMYDNIMVTDELGNEQPLGLTKAQIDGDGDEHKGYVDAFFAEGSVFEDGHTYTLPFAKSTEVMYYNKDVFDKYADEGLKVPTTWKEMEEACEFLLEHEIKDDLTKYPFYYDSDANWFITMCQQYGSEYTSIEEGHHFLFDNPQNREFVGMLRDWFSKHYFLTQATNGDEYGSNYFKAGKTFMSIGSTGGAQYQQGSATDGDYLFEVGIAPVPQVDPENPKSILQGPSVCIFKDKNPQKVIASWLLVKFLTTDVESQIEYSTISGYIPVIKDAIYLPEYQTFLDRTSLIARTAKTCKELVDAGAFYTSPAFVGSSTAREQMDNLMYRALKYGDLDKAFADALAECRYFAKSN